MSRRRTMEAILASDYVSIGELARLTGCRYSTLKHYTEEGMLPFEQEEETDKKVPERTERTACGMDTAAEKRRKVCSGNQRASCKKSADLFRAGIRILWDDQLPGIKVWGQK